MVPAATHLGRDRGLQRQGAQLPRLCRPGQALLGRAGAALGGVQAVGRDAARGHVAHAQGRLPAADTRDGDDVRLVVVDAVQADAHVGNALQQQAAEGSKQCVNGRGGSQGGVKGEAGGGGGGAANPHAWTCCPGVSMRKCGAQVAPLTEKLASARAARTWAVMRSASSLSRRPFRDARLGPGSPAMTTWTHHASSMMAIGATTAMLLHRATHGAMLPSWKARSRSCARATRSGRSGIRTLQ